ncbi:Zinc finger matrin-type protein 3-like protein [Plakobranchus ocellatus]|uniref:Zinc finger matrin-type protein 3-like protein n=1 Tax=Plakobranchus ocellatus TaxID=259542 RepID=A0AAV3ZNY9_9GAST|nr:Zinc finger matrin-type protein 3-like protein [Plakobranchus ocellatus]
MSFSQPSQAEMHYKGKNHAKKLKSVGGVNGNGPEVFECKICCVTVTAQEHLTAHLNGARHKLQVRKIDANENYSGSVPNRGRGGLGYRGRGGRGGGSDWKAGSDGNMKGGRGGFRGRGRFDFRGRGHDQGVKQGLMDYTDEELMNLFSIEPSKKFCFDLANYRTPSGSYYCSSCDVSMCEEPQFLLHLGSRKHQDKVLGKKKRVKKNANTIPFKDNLNSSFRRD